MSMSRFEDLLVWQRARALAVSIYKVTGSGRLARDLGLRDQIQRAAVSIMSNIAEGFERYSRADFRNFLAIARRSAAEVRSQLYLAYDLGCIGAEGFDALLLECVEIGRMIAGLRSSLDR